MKSPLIVIIYDSIYNSVFESQVLQPLIQHTASHQPVIIVSYEKVQPDSPQILKINLAHPNISLIILKRWPLIDKINSLHNVLQLQKILKPLTMYSMLARGPIAGSIALKAKTAACLSLTIQARGLLAEEYAFTHRRSFTILKKIYYHLFKRFEINSYQKAIKKQATIEAVSPALKEYLQKNYSLEPQQITVALHDTPITLSPKIKADWKAVIKEELGIPATSTVYCYNGSIKEWQCPQEVVAYFRKIHQKNQQTFLLVLTQDTQAFRALIQQQNIPSSAYLVRQVPHAMIYRYLAACDIGIIFREPHLINWTSRPTKVLEYQAAGLEIVHNNTIAFLDAK